MWKKSTPVSCFYKCYVGGEADARSTLSRQFAAAQKHDVAFNFSKFRRETLTFVKIEQNLSKFVWIYSRYCVEIAFYMDLHKHGEATQPTQNRWP